MDAPLENWWEREDGLLHPTAPLSEAVRFPTPMRLPASLQVVSYANELQVRYPVEPDLDALEIRIHGSRMVVTTERPGTASFARATTLPDNLDLARQRIRITPNELLVVVPRHPVSAWVRRWRIFKTWFVAGLQRLRARFASPSDG